MTSKRLTKAIKEDITNNMCRELFKPREEAAEKQMVELGDAIYQTIHTEEEKAYIAKAPEGAFRHRTQIFARFYLDVNDSNYRSIDLSKAMPLFSRCDGNAVSFNKDHPLCVRYAKIKKEMDQITWDKAKLLNSTRAILDSATTIKKLLEVWPDAASYLPEEDEASNLPAIPVAALNDMISTLKNNAEAAA